MKLLINSKIHFIIEMSGEYIKNSIEEYLNNKSLILYRKILKNINSVWRSGLCSNDEKFDVFCTVLEYANIEEFATLCDDELAKLRDTILFVKNDELESLIALLCKLINSSKLKGFARIYTAVHLYNTGFLNVCYKCFEDLSGDPLLEIEYRIEAIKFLFASGSECERKTATERMIDILKDKSVKSDIKYKTIIDFSKRTGISTIFNRHKLNVPYEEEFVYALQACFFIDDYNDVKYRILSGQHLLQIAHSPSEDTNAETEIIRVLFGIVENGEYSENIRADAADVILRLGTDSDKLKARLCIIDMGFTADGTRRKLITPKNIYDNSQNVHNQTISEYAEKILEKLASDNSFKIISYEHFISDISQLCRITFPYTNEETEEGKEINLKRNKIYAALQRIDLDTAVFTTHHLTSAEIFTRIWSYIHSDKFNTEEVFTLEKRMLNELLDMVEKCSTGYAYRGVNVLSGISSDDSLKISWNDQIVANIAGRIQAKINACFDRESILAGMLKDADADDREIYINFIRNNITLIEKEMYDEYVVGGYISHSEFEEYFTKPKNEWLYFDR